MKERKKKTESEERRTSPNRNKIETWTQTQNIFDDKHTSQKTEYTKILKNKKPRANEP